jgi:hypothetical protein
MMAVTDPRRNRIFVSFAARDVQFADAFVDFIRLGCNLAEEQVFCTARPGSLDEGVSFAEAIRGALQSAAMSVLLLTPAYYESTFCTAELGAVWIDAKPHVPVLVPPVDYASLDGVQLGEQALKLDRPRDLDELRDRVREAFGVEVPTAQWNRQRDAFLTTWDTELKEGIARPSAVPAERHTLVKEQLASVTREMEEVREARARLERFGRELRTQNEQLREQVSNAPSSPTLDETDETTRAIGEAKAAIEVARRHMQDLPPIVREALFQQYHDARPLTVGGYSDTFSTDVARQNVEQGYLTWIEDSEQMVTPRTDQPTVDDADSSLRSLRETVFEGVSWDSRAEAPTWIRPLLKDAFGIADPTFELRPTWEALELL